MIQGEVRTDAVVVVAVLVCVLAFLINEMTARFSSNEPSGGKRSKG